MDAGPGTDLGSAGWDLGIWVTMMAAMMLPSPAPMVLLFRVAQALAVVLVALGVWVAVAPGSVPGLTRPGSEMKMDEMLPTSSRLLA
jgi:hypothetical protein